MPDSISTWLNKAYAQLASSSATAILDAEVLLCHCLGKNRSFLRAWSDQLLTTTQQQQYANLLKQRQTGVPIAYLTGEREFWSRTFKVSPAVLIPRPDSELLIELSLSHLSPINSGKLLDLGTGSGILAITIAAERPQLQIQATDISPTALEIAHRNAQVLLTTNVKFIHSNWFSAITDSDFDLIISNPPYIAEADPHLRLGDLRFEPNLALVSPENGLQDIRIIVEQARHHLKPQGSLLIEHGYNQQADVQTIFTLYNFQNITTHTDYGGQPRVTSGIWNP